MCKRYPCQADSRHDGHNFLHRSYQLRHFLFWNKPTLQLLLTRASTNVYKPRSLRLAGTSDSSHTIENVEVDKIIFFISSNAFVFEIHLKN